MRMHFVLCSGSKMKLFGAEALLPTRTHKYIYGSAVSAPRQAFAVRLKPGLRAAPASNRIFVVPPAITAPFKLANSLSTQHNHNHKVKTKYIACLYKKLTSKKLFKGSHLKMELIHPEK